MAYNIDPATGDIIINGWENGIGASPYNGLTDMRSINPASIAGEAAINFATQSVTQAPKIGTSASPSSGTVATATGYLSLPQSFNAETGQWVFLVSAGTSGLSTTQPYYLKYNSSGSGVYYYALATAFNGGTFATVSADSAVTLYTIIPTKPKFFTQDPSLTITSTDTIKFMIDDSGRVWSNYLLSGYLGGPATSSWTYIGNDVSSGSTADEAKGNGLVYWRTSNASSGPGGWDGWLLIFRNGQIDLCNVDGFVGSSYNHIGLFTYAWQSGLTGQNTHSCPHNAIVGPDGNVYFCDLYNVRKLYQADLVTPTAFNPAVAGTYVYATFNLLPITDVSTCISPFGANMIIGGTFNQAYVWDTFSNLVSYPILLAESYVSQIVTINTSAFLFIGNRGNIYITNGSQASPWAKVPDHLSNTVEPYFAWGGATYQKNRLYFSISATTNGGVAIGGYGGVWAADVATKSVWLSNQLSYGTYNGYASALASIPIQRDATFTLTNPAGAGLLIGWTNTAASPITYGVDTTLSTPYTGGQSYVVSDMLPIGTSLNPITPLQVEFKLTTPLLTGEEVEIQVAPIMSTGTNPTFTSALITNGDGVLVSGNSQSFPIQKNQWLLVKAILTGKSSGPSFNRLRELRVMGATVSGSQMQAYRTQ